ncbi:MAG: class I SAM-dependent methyltransferase [Chloroflexi bacterium]|nr:class I SAM-dependent methyltransferase [Chloroflexota bacterium]MQC27135.1 class I SAM-dependent methyltransferase [Chloroflexota bacterium]
MSGDHFREIYRKHGKRYQALIEAEDADGNLLPALEQIVAFKGKRVLDVGSGTGRLPMILRGSGADIVALDLYRDMLDVGFANVLEFASGKIHDKFQSLGFLQADLREIPLVAGWADVVIAGWAIGHFVGWYGDDWEAQARHGLTAMQRAARPDGTLIILETMGTGVVEAGPPTPGLAAYYGWLEGLGFERRVVSTDYDFGSVERAAVLCKFFFGAELAAKVRSRGWSRVREWTGIWAKRSS